MDTILNNRTTQGVYVNIPVDDWNLFCELARKFGWQASTREQLLEQFVNSRPLAPSVTEDDIMSEVLAVRYQR